jgi:hypothetical protein
MALYKGLAYHIPDSLGGVIVAGVILAYVAWRVKDMLHRIPFQPG